jgi:hypothetical protein
MCVKSRKLVFIANSDRLSAASSGLGFDIRLMELHWATFGLFRSKIEHFNKYGKGHRGINVALWNMLAPTFGKQSHTDKQQEA